jgi:hypothetical protein
MERKLLTDDDRALLRTLLTDRIGTRVAFPDGGDDPYTAEQCFRLLKKIEGPGKLLVVESEIPFAMDGAALRAEESGCG